MQTPTTTPKPHDLIDVSNLAGAAEGDTVKLLEVRAYRPWEGEWRVRDLKGDEYMIRATEGTSACPWTATSKN